MAQATLIRVLEEIRTLEPEELRMVDRALQAQLAPAECDDPNETVLQAMLKAGVITEIKRPDRSPRPDTDLVPILGKPLSELIIEDRR